MNATIEQEVAAAVAQWEKTVEHHLARIREDRTAAERRIAELDFDRLVRENALLGGVLPKAVEHIAASARELFELRDNAIAIRNGETEPGDPLTPLRFDTWLQQQRKELGFLFVKE